MHKPSLISTIDGRLYIHIHSKRLDLQSLPVMSEEYGLMGKIDIYKGREQKLIERKYQLRNIYQGQIYQLWAQYLCMKEMGYDVRAIAY